ncbi:MAG TPA: magnesium chelatase, partial [Phaeodactylibacter sp.]|nr:magnesium chelatase [Phaeodactylibacter sp.]
MLVKTYASAVQGVEAQTITVEVNAGGPAGDGKDFLNMVGLPDSAVREGFARILTAIKNVRLRIPRVKLVVNLAPADLRKEGSAYDLPIAIGLLASTNQMSSEDIDKYVFMGELSLDGGLRPIKGALPIAIQARKEGYKGLILPKQNARSE